MATAALDKKIVYSVGKAFRVLEVFSKDNAELILADLARAAGLDNATTFRLVNTLVALGYVEKVGETRRFKLTLKCLDLGFNAIARSGLRDLSRPLLRSLVNQQIEAASVGVLDGANVVYIERINAGFARLAVDIRIGNRVPTYASAIGQAILGCLPEAAQIRCLESQPRSRFTDQTLIDLDRLLTKIRVGRERGYALSDGENISGLRVLAAPVTDVDGSPLAGLSVAAPAFGQSVTDFETLARAPVIDAAQKLSAALQAAGGSVSLQRDSYGSMSIS